MHATFILELGDLAESTAGDPKAVAPAARAVVCRKRRRDANERGFMAGLNGCVGMTIPAIFERKRERKRGRVSFVSI